MPLELKKIETFEARRITDERTPRTSGCLLVSLVIVYGFQFILLFGNVLGLTAPLLVLLLLGVTVHFWIRRRPSGALVTVGSDGVLIRQSAHHRFISFAEISHVQIEQSYAQPLCVIVLAIDQPVSILVRDQQEQSRLKRALIHRLAAFNQTLDDDALPVAARACRLTAEARTPNFRTQATSPEVLRTLCLNPTAPVELRAAAANALDKIGEDGRLALQRAAEATAEPRCRVVLRELADAETSRRVPLLATLLEDEQCLVDNHAKPRLLKEP